MRPPDSSILLINGGSSSVIFALFEASESLLPIAGSGIERIEPNAVLWVKGDTQADNTSRSATAPDHTADEVIALFFYKLTKWIGAFLAALCGMDTLVFAGGIGENVPTVRARICEGPELPGIELNQRCSAEHVPLSSPDCGRVKVQVIHTDKELIFARSVVRVLDSGSIQELKP